MVVRPDWTVGVEINTSYLSILLLPLGYQTVVKGSNKMQIIAKSNNFFMSKFILLENLWNYLCVTFMIYFGCFGTH